MNDLQTTLLLVGGGGIVGMIAYNWWQDFRLRKQASERFGVNSEDPLLGDLANPAAGHSPSSRGEPSLSTEREEPSINGGTQTAENQVQTVLDKRLFTEIMIRFENPVHNTSWAALVDGLESINRKRVVFSVATSETPENDQLWFVARSFKGDASLMKINLQLANRNGPLSSIEFSEVLGKIRHFAESHHGDVDFPEMKEVMHKAETLDQAAAALDTLLGLHCMLPETVEQGLVVDMLNTAGWAHKGHQWHLYHEGNLLVSMVIHNAPGKRLLSFNIDVPNSADPVQALGDVVTFCHTLNSQFGAPMMDDSGRTLTTEAIEGIYKQLLERIRNLGDSGFASGSEASKILFS
ncbi:MAG: hypothetical protein QE278_08720 [Limnobacter sp.]|nr:hypothetical protein [Limnobacter sp.]